MTPGLDPERVVPIPYHDETDLELVQSAFAERGAVCFQRGSALLSDEQFVALEALINQVRCDPNYDKGFSTSGHSLYVYPIITDKAGERPRVLHSNASEISAIVGSEEFTAMLAQARGIDEKLYLRRAQVHLMKRGDFLSDHVDTIANPDYRVAVSIVFDKPHAGGTFRVYQGEFKEDWDDYAPSPGEPLLVDAKWIHGIQKVRDGVRLALVLFYANNLEENPSYGPFAAAIRYASMEEELNK
ncbi:MAG: 2OG-Fe(II) oxygenase [Deltaproteobacteria bacterium]|nr:2OG-Fe(II) oxygenase [Deltaproteobacteria bacterium]